MLVISDFERFVGLEVSGREIDRVFVSDDDVEHRYVEHEIIADDPVFFDLNTVLAAKGIMRVWFPGSMGTCELHPGRLNVHFEKASEGRYTIVKVSIG